MSKQPEIKNPLFARVWPAIAKREPASVTDKRREILSGLSGRVLEVGAGCGTNFDLYPSAVQNVVALEPELHLYELACERARELTSAQPTPKIEVFAGVFEDLSAQEIGSFDAVVCSLVLCTVDDPAKALSEAYAALKPGGKLVYLEHVATDGALGKFQKFSDATYWPRLFGGCHTHRNTEAEIVKAGFAIESQKDELQFPRWLPIAASPIIWGVAAKPL